MKDLWLMLTKYYIVTVILASITGVYLIINGISHYIHGFGNDFVNWEFDPLMISIGAGFLVFARILYAEMSYDRLKNYSGKS